MVNVYVRMNSNNESERKKSMNETVIKSNAGKSFFFVLESFLIFLIGMSNIGNEIARGEKVFVSELCIYMILIVLLLTKIVPCKVILAESGIRYRRLLGKEIVVPYGNLLKIQKRQTVMTIGAKWIYLYSKYVLFVKDTKGKTVKLKMSSLDEGKFEKVIDHFMEAEVSMEAEKFSNPSWHQKISVPVKQLRKSFSYAGKRAFVTVCAIILIANTLDAICMTLEGRQSTVSSYIAANIIFFLIVGLIILILYRKDFFCRKKAPNEVYLCSTYIQCDDTRYELDHILDGTFTAAQYLGKREIKFKYNDKKVVLRFGKHNKEQREVFAEYNNLVHYFMAKGFQREILHK